MKEIEKKKRGVGARYREEREQMKRLKDEWMQEIRFGWITTNKQREGAEQSRGEEHVRFFVYKLCNNKFSPVG
mgnify:CR=1 FL=1